MIEQLNHHHHSEYRAGKTGVTPDRRGLGSWSAPSTSSVTPLPPSCASPDPGPKVPLLDDPPGGREFSVHTTLSPLPRPEPPARWCPLMCAPPGLRSGWGSCWLWVWTEPACTDWHIHMCVNKPPDGEDQSGGGKKSGVGSGWGQLPQHGHALALNTGIQEL